MIDLKSEDNIRCDGKVFLEMYLKSYGFYNGTLVASQARDEIFLSEPPTQNHTAVFVTCFSSFSLKKVWRSGYWKSRPTSTRLCVMILFRFCSYSVCCLSMGGSYNFRLCFELQNVTPVQNNIAPGIRSWCDEAKNIVDCSYFFNFEGCIIATQIH